jgi:hypothetical protein
MSQPDEHIRQRKKPQKLRAILKYIFTAGKYKEIILLKTQNLSRSPGCEKSKRSPLERTRIKLYKLTAYTN